MLCALLKVAKTKVTYVAKPQDIKTMDWPARDFYNCQTKHETMHCQAVIVSTYHSSLFFLGQRVVHMAGQGGEVVFRARTVCLVTCVLEASLCRSSTAASAGQFLVLDLQRRTIVCCDARRRGLCFMLACLLTCCVTLSLY